MRKLTLFLVSLFVLSGTAFSYATVIIDLDAKLYPASVGPGGPLGHYRTYYKPGDHVTLSASHPPGYKWGISWNDGFKDAKYVFTITNNNTNDRIYYYEKSTPLHASNSGYGIGFTIPSSAKPGDSYTFTVSLSVSGLDIKPINKKYASTIIRVTDESSTDLWIPFMGEFDQGDWVWGGDFLGTCTTTMAKDGCATTAKAFLFSYLDYNYRWNYQPGILNNCLTLQGGYARGCLISGEERFATKCKPYDVLWEGYYNGNGVKLSNRIRESLDSGFPVIVKADQYDNLHYYLIVGQRANNKWNVFDPLDGQIHYMEDRKLNNNMILGAYFYSQW